MVIKYSILQYNTDVDGSRLNEFHAGYDAVVEASIVLAYIEIN